MKKTALIYPVFILILLLCACTIGSGTARNATELNTPTKMSMQYDKFNGFKETSLKVEDGGEITVSVNIITEKGSIDAYIAKNSDQSEAAYEGHDVPTSSFTVTLSEPGTYTIRVDADDHCGAYSFSWD